MGQVVQDTDRKCVIEGPRKGQIVDVCLQHVGVRQITSCGICSFNGRTEIDADNLFCSPAGSELRMTTFTAAAFQDHLVAKELRCHRLKPAEILLSVPGIFLGKVGPLPTKVCSSLLFVVINFL